MSSILGIATTMLLLLVLILVRFPFLAAFLFGTDELFDLPVRSDINRRQTTVVGLVHVRS